MQVFYKLVEEADNKFNDHLKITRPKYYNSKNITPNDEVVVTDVDNYNIRNMMGRLFSEGDELIQESIESIINLMIENSDILFQSDEFRKRKDSLPLRFIKFLKNPLFLNQTLLLLSILLEKSSEFDKPLINKGIAPILAQIFDNFMSDDTNISILVHLFNIAKLLAQRRSDFCHELFETDFYENNHLPFYFSENKVDENGESINMLISSLLYKTCSWNDNTQNEIEYILNMVPLLLRSDDISIITIGYDILSKISIQSLDTISFLSDGLILQNIISHLTNDTDFEFIINTILMLSKFASLGGQIIDIMDSLFCLQNIADLADFDKNPELISCIFELSKYWFIEQNNSLENMFIFLQNIDFIYIFENLQYTIKEKAIHILRLAASADFSGEITDIVNYDLLAEIVSQISFNDISLFSYNGCFLIRTLIDDLCTTQFCDQIKECLMNEDFCNRLEEIQSLQDSDENDLIEIASEILSFIHDESPE